MRVVTSKSMTDDNAASGPPAHETRSSETKPTEPECQICGDPLERDDESSEYVRGDNGECYRRADGHAATDEWYPAYELWVGSHAATDEGESISPVCADCLPTAVTCALQGGALYPSGTSHAVRSVRVCRWVSLQGKGEAIP